MCTAATFRTADHYFGRNLDYEFSYCETVTITPRRYPFAFRAMGNNARHYALIGMAFVQDGVPLYYDATNEKGLSVAGLNFPGNACYLPKNADKDNVAPFELIPYLLAQCADVAQAEEVLKRVNVFDENFSDALPHSPLHWLVADRERSIVVEPMREGLKIYDDPVGILTNNPPFSYHLTNLNNYVNLSAADPIDRFAPDYPLTRYSRGMGGLGLPGDLSSASRFVRAAFTKLNARCGEGEEESVNQFFHILTAVEQQKGCCKVEKGYEHTIYSSCCNTDKGVYYYTTYNNRRITGVDLHCEDLDAAALVSYPLEKGELYIQNARR